LEERQSDALQYPSELQPFSWSAGPVLVCVPREAALAKLSVLAKDFVKRSLMQKGYSEVDAQEAGGKIFTFGSYRLGVHGAWFYCSFARFLLFIFLYCICSLVSDLLIWFFLLSIPWD
jgi:hypothetical protein